jgi:hypothetical protein
MRKYLAICVCLVVFANVLAQTKSKSAKQRKPVKQPPDVVEAYRVCAEFRRLLAENFDFDRAFEATFTKDPARRREIAITESEIARADLAAVDDATLVGIYKDRMQLYVLIVPLLFSGDERAAELFPPEIKQILERRPPKEAKDLKTYAVQLKEDVASLRAHFDQLAAKNAFVADRIRDFRTYLSKPLDPPNHVIQPITAYSKGRVLPLDAKYYQIDDYAVIREGGEMRIIGFTLIKMRG